MSFRSTKLSFYKALRPLLDKMMNVIERYTMWCNNVAACILCSKNTYHFNLFKLVVISELWTKLRL